jgi:Mg-chelatase subunit ChlD
MDQSIPDDVFGLIADCKTPYLIGVRHHSAALARVIPELLAAFKPEAILLEMPSDFLPWLEYLSKEDLIAPVALAASDEAQLISFYPLADFSPELSAIRWAAANKVPVIPCDLDLAGMRRADVQRQRPSCDPDTESTALNLLLHRYSCTDVGDLWEKLVETPASQSSPESIRRAALFFGWMIRHSSNGPTYSDACREAAMRNAIAAAPRNSVALVGSFHAAALLPDPVLWSEPVPNDTKESLNTKPVTSLIPYSFAQLDHRSGYPAGVKDPMWHQAMLSAATPESARHLIADLAVELCRRLRDGGHVAGTPDAIEIVRLAQDLGRLRGHASPGRGEFLEAIESTLVQGDLMGRGRAVAAVAQNVLVGTKRGRLPIGTPRSGLSVQVEAAIHRLKLPGPEEMDAEPRELRLDPLRSKLDRSRAVLFRRLNMIGVHYATRFDTEGIGDRENLTEAWKAQWTGATTSMLEAAGINGVTLTQVCESAVRRISPSESNESDAESAQFHPATILSRITAAAECGLGGTVKSLLQQIDSAFLQNASVDQLVQAAVLKQRISSGYVSGLPLREEDAALPDVERFVAPPELLDIDQLLQTALRRLDALSGSDEQHDVVALVELTALIRGDFAISTSPSNDGSQDEASSSPPQKSSLTPSLTASLFRIRRNGSPRMQGAAWGALAMLEQASRDELAAAIASWFDAGSIAEGRKQLKLRLQGLMEPLLSLVIADPDWHAGLEQRLESAPDDDFMSRLPALRGGFQNLPPGDRAQLLRDRLAIIEPGGPARTMARPIDDPVAFAAAIAADRAGRSAIARLLPDFVLHTSHSPDAADSVIRVADPPGEIPLADRWRMILGVKGCSSPKAQRCAGSLDQLYGRSTGTGRGQKRDLAQGGGTEAPAPSAREWIADLEELFDKDVYEEVIGEAAANGRAAVLEHMNPESVRPSIGLLEQILSLRGALPERELGHLRKLARKITERLAQQLANRLRPALTGLSTPRPTRRKSRRLDFVRTLDTNLDTAYRCADGRIALAPRRLVFRSPAKRQMDWHLIFVVDVSGSMEASVIYSALVAAIFSALPAIDVRFFAFSTQVIDLTGSVDDPLALLLEVQVGGGTHIGLGLRAARDAVKNPSRTLVVLVTDFEEGVSIPELLSEVRMLSETGAKLLGLAALDDAAKPRYNGGIAANVVAAGMPVAAVSPERLAQWVGDHIRGTSS